MAGGVSSLPCHLDHWTHRVFVTLGGLLVTSLGTQAPDDVTGYSHAILCFGFVSLVLYNDKCDEDIILLDCRRLSYPFISEVSLVLIDHYRRTFCHLAINGAGKKSITLQLLYISLVGSCCCCGHCSSRAARLNSWRF